MIAALQKPTDLSEFLSWEERQELRHEFDGVRTIAMTGGTGAHAAIQFGLARVLGNRLLGGRCRVYGSELKIKMEYSIRYPDAFVVCTPVPPTATTVTDPVVVFEILSKSTGNEDLGAKRAEYQAAPSIQRYIILQQTHRAAIVFARAEEGWDYSFVFGEGAVLDMPEIGINVPLAEIYQGIALESDPALA